MGLIKSRDAKRIAENANIAISSLKMILMMSENLQSEYLKHELKTVRSCLEFMEEFQND